MNDKKTLKIFNPDTFCTKFLSVIESKPTWTPLNVLLRTNFLVSNSRADFRRLVKKEE